MSWPKTVQQTFRNAHSAGCWDLLRALLDVSDREPGHECQALEWARRLYADPELFDQFIRDSQAEREQR